MFGMAERRDKYTFEARLGRDTDMNEASEHFLITHLRNSLGPSRRPESSGIQNYKLQKTCETT